MKKLFILFLGLIVFLSACGGDDEQGKTEEQVKDEAETNSLTDQDDLLTNIQEIGELKIGTEGTYPPFTFHDETGELTGFDVEIAREVAARLGVEPVFLETQWDAMFAGLDAERFDMIANQVGIRPDRQEKYDFSDPYISSSAVLVTQKDNEAVSSFEDIAGLKAAQSLTSNYADIAKEHGAEITGVEGFNQAIELLSSGRVDVTINDKLSVLDFLKQKPDAPIKIAATSEDASQSGLMFRQDNETLVEAVNQALTEMKEDGTYLEISEKWFGEDVSK
ncbi:amino acid ABC transporter substrate-binding protein [Bacillus sp. AK128]